MMVETPITNRLLASTPDAVEVEDCRRAVWEIQMFVRVDPESATARVTSLKAHLGANSKLYQGFIAELEAVVHGNRDRDIKALEACDLAQPLYETYGQTQDCQRLKVHRLFPLMDMGRFPEAARIIENLHAYLTEQPDRDLEAELLLREGWFSFFQNDAETAIRLAQKSRALFEALGNPYGGAIMASTIAHLQFHSGQPLQALRGFHETLNQAEILAMPLLKAQVLRNLGISLHELSLYDYALECFHEAVGWCERNRVERELLMTRFGLGELYVDLGMLDEALESFRSAASYLEREGNVVSLMQCRLREAYVLTEQKKFLAGRQLLDHAEKLAHKISDSATLLRIRYQQCLLLLEQGRIGAANAALEQLITDYDRPEYAARWKAWWLFLHGVCQERLGNLSHALARYQEVAQTTAAVVPSSVLWKCHYRLAILKAQTDSRGAKQHLEQAITLLEQQRIQRDETHGIAYRKDRTMPYLLLARLLADAEPAHAVVVMEKAKSRMILDLFLQHCRLKPQTEPSLTGTSMKLHKLLEGLPLPTHCALSSAKQGMNVNALELQLFYESLMQRLPHSGTLNPITREEFAKVQALLKADAAVVYFFPTEESVSALTITNHSVTMTALDCSALALADLLEDWRLEQLLLCTPELLSQHEASLVKRTQKLLNLMSQPFAALFESLADYRNLIIIPHGDLHTFPFHLLRVHGEYLLDCHEISYAPSLTLLYWWLTHKPKPRGNPLVLYNPSKTYPWIDYEVAAIRQTIAGVNVASSEDLRSDQLPEAIYASDLIHLVGHGSFRHDNPLYSSITWRDAKLYAKDFYAYDVSHCALIFLNACETGMSVIREGDELLGFTRAFLINGARAVIATQWSVGDRPSATLVALFYRFLGANHPPSVALRLALLELRQTFSHPLLWGAWCFTGDHTVAAAWSLSRDTGPTLDQQEPNPENK